MQIVYYEMLSEDVVILFGYSYFTDKHVMWYRYTGMCVQTIAAVTCACSVFFFFSSKRLDRFWWHFTWIRLIQEDSYFVAITDIQAGEAKSNICFNLTGYPHVILEYEFIPMFHKSSLLSRYINCFQWLGHQQTADVT